MKTNQVPDRDAPTRNGLSGLALYLGATLLAALAMVSIVRAQAERPPNPAGADGLPQSAGTQQPVTDAMIWRAASRLGYAPTPELVEAIRRAPGGAQGWALAAIDAAAAASTQAPQIPQPLATFNQPLPTLFDEYRKEREARREVRVEMAAQGQPMQAGQMQPGQQATPRPAALADLPNISRDATQTAAAWRLQACSDPRLEDPLTARMTEFWFNHFNVFAGKGQVRPFLGHYVTNAIRPNVLGPFDQLVLATARHPAMLNYLDQSQSVAEGMMVGPANNRQRRGLNENYARELMELHTLGVHGGYTQNDVRELARVLTGWTLDPNAPNGFRFAARAHDTGEKIVLGQRFGNEGEAEGVRAIEMLANHPATAQRIALRLAQWFVADNPPKALTDRLAASFSASRGNLRTVMRTLVQSPEFWDERAQLVKTPMDYACSTLALTGGVNPTTQPGVGERRVRTALGFLAQAGQPMHGWQTPDGYKVDAATWVAPEALTRRADLAFALARDAQPGTDPSRFLAPATLARIQQEPEPSRLALMLASPEFMKK